MTLFFALSGFLITSNIIAGQRIQSFFIRRLTRILPLAYLYLTVVFIVLTFDPHRFLGNLFFLENYADVLLTSWNAHFWSLCVEVHFYLVIGILAAVLGPRAIWVVVPTCLAVTMLRVFEGAHIDIRTHLRVDEILAGASVALAFHNRWLPGRLSQIWIFAAALFWFVASWSVSGIIQYLRPYSSATLLIVVLCSGEGLVLTFLRCRTAKYIARISYALYVIHPATAHGWMNDGSVVERYLLKRPISVALTFLLAHLSTFYWEERWIAWGKRWSARSKPLKDSPLRVG